MKKILITGASAGIGKSMVEVLSQKYEIYACARRIEKLESLKNELSDSSNFHIFKTDLNNRLELDAFVEEIPPCNILINNAGLALGSESFENYDWSDIEIMIQTNLIALMYLTKKMIPGMLKLGNGHIVNLGSVAGERSYKGGSAYCATKAAVHSFSLSLRQDLAGKNIRVTTVAPGRVHTEFSDVRFKGNLEAAKKVYSGFRTLEAVDVARNVEWILSQPEHVNIEHITLYSTDQIDATTVVG